MLGDRGRCKRVRVSGLRILRWRVLGASGTIAGDMESGTKPELHVTVDLAAARHYAGDELPLGALLLGIVREGARDVGALLLMPRGLWVRYNSGAVRPLPPLAGAKWLGALRAKRRLKVEEIGPLAGVKPETFAGWEAGEQAVSVNHIRRLLRALHMNAGP